MKQSIRFSFLAIVTLVLLTSCNVFDKSYEVPGIEYIAFIADGDEKWGLISPQGEVLFSNEFSEPPSIVRNGRFFVKDDEDNLYYMYSAEQSPRKVTETGYVDVYAFINGKALVVPKNKGITLIDTEGETLATFDEIDGKEVVEGRMFDDGHIRLITDDGLQALYSPEGKQILPANYSSIGYGYGIIAASPASDKKYYDKDEFSKCTDIIMNLDGKELCRYKGKKYITCGIYDPKHLGVCRFDEEGNRLFGVITPDGEAIVEPEYPSNDYFHGLYTYEDDDKYGVKNIDGQTLIEASYDNIIIVSDYLLIVGNLDDDFNYTYKLVDINEKEISSEEFTDYKLKFDLFDGRMFVADEEGKWKLIDKDGKIVDGLPEISELAAWGRSDDLISDKFEPKKLIGKWESPVEDTNSSLGMDFKKDNSITVYIDISEEAEGVGTVVATAVLDGTYTIDEEDRTISFNLDSNSARLEDFKMEDLSDEAKEIFENDPHLKNQVKEETAKEVIAGLKAMTEKLNKPEEPLKITQVSGSQLVLDDDMTFRRKK